VSRILSPATGATVPYPPLADNRVLSGADRNFHVHEADLVAVGSRGKSGGARVIYYWAVRRDVILLLYAYPKNVRADLTPKQIVQLAKVVKEEFGNEKGDV
jgi:hypothetical protein